MTEGIMQSQEEIMRNIIDLVKVADGGLTSEEESFLRSRYYDWITTQKKGVDTTPQQVWEQDAGKKIQERIREIGKLLSARRQQKKVLGKDDCLDVCSTVESDSACPHCPDPTG
jgi:hypothetical protein